MYFLHRTREFEKSFKRLERSGLSPRIREELADIIDCLASGEALGSEYKDHKLNGEYEDYRECHIRGDLLLLYQIRKKELVLLLVDIGSHSYLFG